MEAGEPPTEPLLRVERNDQDGVPCLVQGPQHIRELFELTGTQEQFDWVGRD